MARKLDIAKKQHRERGQPVHRTKFGLLEKHSDYVKRARDYHSKQDRLKILKSKASQRNKDEFNFGMHTHTTRKGVHYQASLNKALDSDTVKLLKSQDVKYVELKKKAEEKAIDKLNTRLASNDAANKNKHTKFTEDVNDLTKPLKKRKTKTTSTVRDSKDEQDQLKAELQARQTRLQNLSKIQRDLQVQKMLLSSKGKRKEILLGKRSTVEQDDDEATGTKLRVPEPKVGIRTGARVFKWKAERKR